MSRKLILYIAISLDWYIARKDKSVDWLTGQDGSPDSDNWYIYFYKTIETI